MGMMGQNGDGPGSNDDLQKQLLKGQQEQAELEKKVEKLKADIAKRQRDCLLYTSPSPRDGLLSRMPSSA